MNSEVANNPPLRVGRAQSAARARALTIPRDLIAPAIIALDGLLLLAGGVALGSAGAPSAPMEGELSRILAGSAVFFAIAEPLFAVSRAYDESALESPRRQLATVASVCALASALLAISARQFEPSRHEIERETAVFAGASALLLLHHLVWSLRLKRGLKSAGIRPQAVAVIIPDGEADLGLRRRLEKLGYEIGLQIRLADCAQAPDGLQRQIRGATVDEIVVAAPLSEITGSLLRSVEATPFPVSLLLNESGRDSHAGSRPFLQVRTGPLPRQGRRIKRLVDVALSVIVLIALAPLLLLAALAIRIESGGPVLFWQTRLGFNGVPFRICKFRSMRVGEDGPSVRAARRGDARVTRVGRVLRRLSIDELPQLINVLRGEMSLVGPRPHALAHDEFYESIVAHYSNRQHVKPGLTGWAQVNGLRGEIEGAAGIAQRLQYDLWYIHNWRLLLDLKILLLTLPALATTDKAY